MTYRFLYEPNINYSNNAATSPLSLTLPVHHLLIANEVETCIVIRDP